MDCNAHPEGGASGFENLWYRGVFQGQGKLGFQLPKQENLMFYLKFGKAKGTRDRIRVYHSLEEFSVVIIGNTLNKCVEQVISIHEGNGYTVVGVSEFQSTNHMAKDITVWMTGELCRQPSDEPLPNDSMFDPVDESSHRLQCHSCDWKGDRDMLYKGYHCPFCGETLVMPTET